MIPEQFEDTGELTQELEKAKSELENFLAENIHVIRAMRSRVQFAEGQVRLSSDQVRELDKFIEEHGGNRFKRWNLCQINDTSEVFFHPNELSNPSNYRVGEWVRGFFFNFEVDNQRFECVDMDAGLSRQYFDKKNPKDRKKFVQRFADRFIIQFAQYADTISDYYHPKNGIVAFISDNGRGFIIEEIVKQTTPVS